jgi:transposase-like protein
MFKTIERPADCEVRSVIRFLNARNVKPADIHRQVRVCEVYGENAMSDGMVRRWVRQFNEGRENVHDEARSGWPSVVNDDLVRAVDSKVHEGRRFTISSLSLHFPQISRTILYEIVRSFELSEVVLMLGAEDAL